MAGTPILHTERLCLRPMESRDFDDFYAYFATDEVFDMIGGYPPKDRAGVLAVLNNHIAAPFTWAITLNETGQLIGDLHFGNIVNHYLAHIGYILNPAFRGNGLMTEAVMAVTDFGFKMLDFGRIRAVLRASNKKSARVLARCGYREEAFLREADFNGRVADLLYYSRAQYDA